MSFSAEVKNELCRIQPGNMDCVRAECCGILLFCNIFTADEIRIITENEAFAGRLPRLFRRAFGVSFDREPEEDRQGKMVFSVTDGGKIARIMDVLGHERAQSLSVHLNLALVEEERSCAAFLRGAFLAGGSLNDPKKSYHMEFVTTHLHVAGETEALLREMGMTPHTVRRSGAQVLYFKQSEALEDMLTLIGAPVSAMELMNTKLEKDLRNQVNRKTNCDEANLDKSLAATQRQIESIRRLKRSGRLDGLPDKLKETAEKRMNYPELPLSELAEQFTPPITKSCLNHRLRKIEEYASKNGGKTI